MKRSIALLLAVVPAAAAAGTLAWAAMAPIESASRQQAYAIPKGTWARRMAGEKLEVLPERIHLTMGVKDILVLNNHDDVPQLFGPVLIMPGQSFELPFGRPSEYHFACLLHASGQLTVVVAPTPEPGWPRLKWRAASLGAKI
jgi:hypothetical protein